MMDNMPISAYATGSSLVHRLRARTKLLLLGWLVVLFFLANHHPFHYGVYAVSFVLFGLAFFDARITWGYVWRRMRLLIILLAIGIPFSLIWTTGTTWRAFGPYVVSYHGFSLPITVVVTYDGIWFSISFTAIFLLLFLSSMLLTTTTTPVALAEGIVLLLRPLAWVGLPADEFGLMTLVALRFVPVLMQEMDQLIKAQISRGADFTTASLSARIKGVSTLLVPLLQGALRRATNLASALESRGYGVTGKATLLHEGRLRLLDWFMLLAVPAVTLAAYLKA